MFKCVICNKTLLLHKFPVKKHILVAWQHNCGLKSSENVGGKRVCSEHFLQEHHHFNSKILKSGAIPLVKLKVPNPITQFNIKTPTYKLTSRKCCLCGFSKRKYPNDKRILFGFPNPRRNRKTLELWKIVCEVSNIHAKYVCEMHFPKNEISKGYISKFSVPSRDNVRNRAVDVPSRVADVPSTVVDRPSAPAVEVVQIDHRSVEVDERSDNSHSIDDNNDFNDKLIWLD